MTKIESSSTRPNLIGLNAFKSDHGNTVTVASAAVSIMQVKCCTK